jgi:hypothetical protein
LEIIAEISRFESEITLMLVSIQKEVTNISWLLEKQPILSLVLRDVLHRVLQGFTNLAENIKDGIIGIGLVDNRM